MTLSPRSANIPGRAPDTHTHTHTFAPSHSHPTTNRAPDRFYKSFFYKLRVVYIWDRWATTQSFVCRPPQLVLNQRHRNVGPILLPREVSGPDPVQG